MSMWRKDVCAKYELLEWFRWSIDSGFGRFLSEYCFATYKPV